MSGVAMVPKPGRVVALAAMVRVRAEALALVNSRNVRPSLAKVSAADGGGAGVVQPGEGDGLDGECSHGAPCYAAVKVGSPDDSSV